jgi:pimeloyl-ACP methyl ester carboxylesterase
MPTDPLPILFVPGLLCTARLYQEQLAALWTCGPVSVANHTFDDSMQAIARRILASAPPRFMLVGLSMGGYIALQIMRDAPERVARLALLDTNSRPETPEQTEARRAQIALVRNGRFAEIPQTLFSRLVHRRHANDAALLQIVTDMAHAVGPDAFVRQLTAIMGRADSRPTLSTIRCPTLVLVGEGDELTPPALAAEIAAGIAGSRLVTVPDCGHVSTLEQPAQVSQALSELLRA